MSFNKRISSLFLLAGGLLAANALLLYISFTDMHRQTKWVSHTYEVIGELEGVISDLKDIQSSQRGFAITGQDDYLTPYSIAISKLEKRLDLLEGLLSDNPAQQERLAALAKNARERAKIATDVIGIMREKGQPAAFAAIKAGHGKHVMDGIRVLLNEMITYEKDLLIQRHVYVQNAATITFLLAVAGFIIGLGVLVLAFILIKKENVKRSQAESSLKQAYQSLKRSGDDDKIISEMSDYLQTCRDLDEAYRIISATLPRIIPALSGAIWIYSNSRDMVECSLAWGEKSPDHTDFDPEKCWALRLGHPHEMTMDGTQPNCAHIEPLGQNAAYCFPMQTQGETLGLISVRFDHEDMLDYYVKNLIERLGKQIALAIANLKLQDRLRNQSVRDPLTGLFNRRYLEETMDREFSRARRSKQSCSILILDIDHFKKYNDTRGHDAGDALLVKFAQLVRETTRKEDIACRYGGEEFVVVLPNTPLDMAEKVGQKICDATRKMKVASGKESFGSVTVSIGVAAFPSHAETPEDLITTADAALYSAKEGGRDQVRIAALPE